MSQYRSFSILLLLSLLSIPALAFFPTTWKEAVFGNGGTSHVQITETAFEDRAKSYFPTLTTISRQMRKARDEIGDANADVDDVQTIASYHCDGESFRDAQARIQSLKTAAINALLATNPDVSLARKSIGQALHTIQDFYAHSNWVELSNSAPNADLIRNGDMSSYSASFADKTCNSCPDIVPPPFWDPSLPLPCGGFDCSANTNGFSKLTSGYYFGEDSPPAGIPIPSYKCHHGGPTDDPHGGFIGILVGTKPGINKDSLNCVWSPHANLHTQAITVATAATEQFFDDIKDALNSQKALRLLFGVPSLAFAIDTTGSMGDIIDTVRAQAIDVASSLIGTDDEPGLYVVSPFNDPDTGPVTVTSDFDTFQNAINVLFAAGGGDCPELSVTGMLNAVDVMDEGSTLIMFTDAAAKDADQSTTLWTEASSKNIQITIFKSDSNCDDGLVPSMKKREDSQADKIFGEICAATGGQYHTGPRTDVTKISTLLQNVISANPVSILRAQGSLAGGSDTFNVPIDSYTTKFNIALLATGFTISITQPDGTPLTPSSAGVTWDTLTTSISVTNTSPKPGTYIVVVSGTGSYILSSNGVSTLQLTSFNFASVGGRPGHTGWYPLSGPPPYNQEIGAIAQVSGGFQTATFTFRAPSFALLATADMTPGSGETGYPATNDFFAILTVPNQNFLVYVSGKDDKGLSYQRVLETPLAPIFATTPYPLAGNQTFNLAGNTTNTTSSTSSISTSSSTSKWGNSTTSKTTITSTPTLTSTTTYLYSTSTILQTNIYTVTSCAPEVENCPARVTTETVTIGTTICPVSLETSTLYSTTEYTVSECPNMAESCAGMGSATTRVVPVSQIVVAVPLTVATTPTSSIAPATSVLPTTSPTSNNVAATEIVSNKVTTGLGPTETGSTNVTVGATTAPSTSPTYVTASGAEPIWKANGKLVLGLGLVGFMVFV